VFRHYQGKTGKLEHFTSFEIEEHPAAKTWFSAGCCREARFPFALATKMDISHDPWLDPLGAVCSEQILALQALQSRQYKYSMTYSTDAKRYARA
jgi:hypothetical protein